LRITLCGDRFSTSAVCSTLNPPKKRSSITPALRGSISASSFMLQHPGVTAPIIGASKMNHLDDAVAALGIKLDEAELKLLTEHYRPRPIMAHT
jgi:aryl-alcohol dehydrogenase-like predicted oxidoreductase